MGTEVVSGVHPNNTYPLVDGELDPEQKRRLAARQDSERARGLEPTTEEKLVNEHPSNTPTADDPTAASSPQEVVEEVREQVAPDAAPVESAPSDAPAPDASTPDTQPSSDS